MHRCCFLLFLLTAFAVRSQQMVEGVVRDRTTGDAVAGAHVVGLGRLKSGTSTNGDGNFVLHSPAHIDSIRISCIGFKTRVIAGIKDGMRLSVALEPHIISLEALTVKPPSPVQLIRDAVSAIPANYSVPPFQLQGFYRETIRNDTTYYSVAEAIFESQLPEAGEEKALLKLVQGRRSESVKGTRIFEDYHPGGGPNSLANNLLEVHVAEFLDPLNFEDYVFAIDSITSYDGHDVYVISFDQHDGLKNNLWKGRICIEAESLAIIDLQYSLSEKGIEFRKHLVGTDKVMANLLGIDFTVLERTNRYSYRKEDGRWRLHDATMVRRIHFIQSRKAIDETFTIQAQLLSLGQRSGPLVPFEKDEIWRKNQLVRNLPGEFDEQFWGANNIIRPEESLAAAVARMDVLRASSLTSRLPDGWSLLHSEQVKAYQQDCTLFLKPYVTSRWKDDGQGPFLWKEISGDFEMQAKVRVTQSQDTTAAPDAGFQAGGLMIRNSARDAENNILLAVGCMGNPQLKVISQHTLNGSSALYVKKVETNELTLRLRRAGSQVELSYLSDQREWVLLRQFRLTDWPEETQVGLAGFAYVPGSGPKRNPDILIRASGLQLMSLKP